MGARIIRKRQTVGGMVRAHRELHRRALVDPTKCAVTLVIHEPTKEVVGVGINWDAADRLRQRINDGEHCELKDMFISI